MSEKNSAPKQGNHELAEEAVECRRHGYILTGKFLGQGAYAKVFLGQAIPEKIQTNYKLKRASNHEKFVKVRLGQLDLIFCRFCKMNSIFSKSSSNLD